MTEHSHHARYCPYCGHPFSVRSLFCEGCGVKTTRTYIEQKERPYPWSPAASISMTLLAFSVATIGAGVLSLYFIVFFGVPLTIAAIESLTYDPLFFFLTITIELTWIVIVVGFVLRSKAPLSRLGLASGGVQTSIKDIAYGLGAALAMVPLMLALVYYQLIAEGAGPPTTPPGSVEIFWLLMNCLAMMVMVAPAEEILFRGFLQNSLDAHYGNIAGLLAASIIFGLGHMNPINGVLQTMLGIILGLLFRMRGRRLLAPITAHGVYNCLVIILDTFFI
ncbi:MAG: type II CAAX prenyl endopeptidase Rce1 family protein [Promethearchaeota archaeon]